MKVVRNKLRLINRKEGTTSVLLTGLPEDISNFVEKAFRKYADPESQFGIVAESYVAEVETPKKAAAPAAKANEPRM